MNTIEQIIAQNPSAVLVAVSNVLTEILETKEIRSNENAQTSENTVPELIDAEKQLEIIDGKVELKDMAGARHGGISARIIVKIGIYLEDNPIGNLYTPDTLFSIGNNDRMPDVSFVSAKQIPETGEPEGQWEIAPDLAVEVISPTDIYSKILKKIREYLNAGVKQVWLVEPEFQTFTIYTAPMKSETLTVDETLICEEILPNFQLKLKEIFRQPKSD